MRRPLTLAVLMAVVASLLGPAGPALAASIDRAEVCVDPDGTMRLLVELTEPTGDEIVFRLNADDGPFPSDYERFHVNFDAATGQFTREPPVEPEVATFGTPPQDRWVDGPVADFSLTPLGGTGQWRVEAGLAPGADAFGVGDTVWGVIVRTFNGADAVQTDLVVAACDATGGGDTSTSTFDFDIEAVDDVPFELFNVLTPGRVTATLEWTGASDTLTAQLTGSRRPALADPAAPYAEVTGTSPLTLTYDVTAADVARGTGWRLVVRDASGASDAEGTLELTTPFDSDLQEQFEAERIRLRSGDVWPSAAQTAAFESEVASSGDGLHGIISLSRACDCQENRALQEVGFHRQSYLPGRDAFGLVEPGASRADPRVAGLVQFLTPLEPEDKIDPHVLVGDLYSFVVPGPDGVPVDHVRNADGSLNLTVAFYEDTTAADSATILNAHATAFEALGAAEYRATVPRAQVTALAADDRVEWIEDAPAPGLPTLDWARATHDVDAVHAVQQDSSGIVVGGDGLPVYDGWTGAGVTATVEEGGRIDATHPDLSNVSNPRFDDFSSHKTHVAGTLAGTGRNSDGDDGNGDPNGGDPFQWRGIAPEASLVDAIGWTIDEAYHAIVHQSSDLSSHSHTLSYNGRYSAGNARLDELIAGRARASGDRSVPARPVVWAAGNEGSNNNPQYANQPGMFGLTGQAKNLLLVGNWCAWCDASGQDPDDPPEGRLTRSSSMGPAYDGRLMPIVVAHGAGVTAPDTAVEAEDADDDDLPGDRYSSKTGTSMATPAVAGVVALLLEAWQFRYADLLATDIDEDAPLPSTLRAILAHTAEDVVDDDVRAQASAEVDSDNLAVTGNDGAGFVRATQGPDYATGFGVVDAEAAMDLVDDHRIEDGVGIPNRIVQGAVGQAGVAEYEFAVDTTGEVKVTLAWDDVESAAQGRADEPMLVNDLDVELVSPSGQVFYPWRLGHRAVDANGAAIPDAAQQPGTPIEVDLQGPRPASKKTKVTIPASDPDEDDETRRLFLDYIPQAAMDPGGAWVADRGKDHLNNIEQVLVENAEPGRWTARVTGFDVETDLQEFALVGMPYPDLPDIRPFAGDQFGLPDLDEDVTFTWSAANHGSAEVASGADYRILLSTDFVVDSDDVVLTDTSGPGRLTATQMNSGSSVESTIRITQADADAVLGTTGATVGDLVDNDVLLLLEVDPISTNEVLEHHEINVLPLSPGRLVDVAVVYDRSGSMNADVRTSLGTRRKVEILDDSARIFFDLMRLGIGDRLGVVSFAGNLGNGTTARHVDLQEIDEGNVGDAAQVSGNLIPVGDTDIRAGLEEALDMLPAAGEERRRVIVFFSDGEATTGADPRDPAFLDRFPAEDVQVFSVGFGTEGGSSYTGIDTQLLELLAGGDERSFARVTDRPVDLDKFFVDALGGAIDWPTILDPVGDLPAGDTHTVDVGVTEEDGQAAFVLTWDDPGGDLDLSLVTPGGTEIDAANAASFGTALERDTGSAHEVMKVQLPLRTGAGEDHAGTWQMRIRNAGAGTVTYSASAIARSTIRGEVGVESPADGVRDAGEPVDFDAAYRTRDGSPIGDATVTVMPRVPLIGAGDVLAAAGLTPAEIAAVPPDADGDPYTEVERMIIALRDRWGTNPIPLADGAPFELPEDGAGGYAGSFGATAVPGPYTFTVRSSFRTQECADSTREQASSVSVEPTVDPVGSGIDLTTTTPGDYELRITPVHTGGGYIGPGHADDVLVVPGGTLVADGPVVDNRDGSYVQVLRSTGSGVGTVEVAVDGVALPTQTVATGGPVATVITPGGGATSATTLVTVGIGPVGDLADITGVLLKGPGGLVEAGIAGADTSEGTLTAVVPAGLEPGAYKVVLTTAGGANAPLKPAEFLAVGAQDPAVLLALDASLTATGDGATTDELLAVLHDLQAVPTGDFLTPADKTAATSEVALAVLAGEGPVSLPAVQQARSLAAIDARYFDLEPAVTEEGSDVSLDLGGGVLATFDSVVSGGTTSVEVVPGPAGIDPTRTGTPYLAYDVTTTASYEGEVSLTFPYAESDYTDESSLRLFHLGKDGWENTTTDLNTTDNRITGKTTTLSPFVILEGDQLPDVVPPPSCMGFAATIVGTEGGDHLVGTPGLDVIVGLGGDDVIEGLGGDDILCGGPGHDRIDGGPGHDRIDGGQGDDVVEGGTGDDRISAGAGADTIGGGDGDDVIDAGPDDDVVDGGNGANRITLGLGNDVAAGGDGPDHVEGGPGDDEIEGHDGPDTLLGGAGADRVLGGDGDDLIRGHDGHDELSGDSGDDLMFGGSGGDVLHGGGGHDATHGGDGADVCSGEVQTSCEETVKDPNRGKGPPDRR